ncbi:hypothetical protein C7U71_26880 [Escherichia coli]|nr:hypothetical protein C7U71_26880 [Escherichia coli]
MNISIVSVSIIFLCDVSRDAKLLLIDLLISVVYTHLEKKNSLLPYHSSIQFVALVSPPPWLLCRYRWVLAFPPSLYLRSQGFLHAKICRSHC